MTEPTYAKHAKESGHWYDPRLRALVEAVPYAKKGASGPPDLRHARKLGLVPGVTTITSCAAAWGLEKWKREQVLMAALTLPRAEGEGDEQFIARVIEDSEAQAADARSAGTAIHAAIQQHFTDGTMPDDAAMIAHVQGVVTAIENAFGQRRWQTEQCVAHQSGYATKVDLWSGSPGRIILDFKSKDFVFADVQNLATYDDHAMQLAAGGVAAIAPDGGADCLLGLRAAIVYVSRTVPGLSWPVAVSDGELVRGWTMFSALLDFWKAKNRYDSSWKQ